MNYKLALSVLSTYFLLPSISYAAKYELDPVHTKVEFGVRHLGINTVKGEFKKFSGNIEYDAKNPQNTKVNAEIDASSLDTGNSKRDEHVKSADFLDVEKFGKITFVSKSAKLNGKNGLKITGDLTIHGVTKSVVLDVTDIAGPGLSPLDKKQHLGGSASVKIVRQDYDIKWNGGGMTGIAGEAAVGNDVKIQIDLDSIEVSSSK
ncbi:YceI family protein [Pigmentibacter sp. JX0631]|uniref:YceI family protein n=1 Tax=Pigmentibacter sp. JX0631 TaxID=2976982 RepID=UPI0024695197|nr:YceI family protein [Pigmentibacter sp. JX0631]WGL60481.1 YceI family protein [Pigmentibacter sp. JX0631]